MTQHLENLTIERFRGLRDLELKDLGQVNLFVGPNNSGKTSVLEAIGTYCRPLDPLEWLNTSTRREVVGGGASSVRLNALRWLFPQSLEQGPDGLYHGQARLRATGDTAIRSMTANYQEIRGVPDEATLKSNQMHQLTGEPDETYQGAELLINSQFKPGILEPAAPADYLQVKFVFWEAASFYEQTRITSEHFLPVRTITPVSHRTERTQVRRFSEAAFNREIGAVLDLIRRFDPDITDLQILESGGTALYLDHKKTGLTPLSAFGDGVRRVVMMALTLPQVEDGVLLIDEIETAIHISVLQEVYQWLFKACQFYNVQLFATTHSLEAVDALLQAPPSAQAGLVAYRLGQPGESAKRYGDEMLKRLRGERGLDVR